MSASGDELKRRKEKKSEASENGDGKPDGDERMWRMMERVDKRWMQAVVAMWRKCRNVTTKRTKREWNRRAERLSSGRATRRRDDGDANDERRRCR